jgi:hypothetical protein
MIATREAASPTACAESACWSRREKSRWPATAIAAASIREVGPFAQKRLGHGAICESGVEMADPK